MLQSQSRAKLRLLEATMASIADGVLILDASGDIVFMNDAARQMTQWEPFLDKSVKDQVADLALRYTDGRIMPPEETPLGLALGGSTVVNFLVVYGRPDGKEMFISNSASPVRDEDGKILGAVSIMRDVTEGRRAEQEITRLLGEHEKQFARAETLATELQHRANELAAVFENTDALLALLDSKFNFVMANAAYVESCGHSVEELIGRNHFELFPDKENQAIFEKVRETGEAVKFHAKPFEYADQPWRGVTYWDWSLVPVKNQAGNVQGLVLSLLDVTKDVQAQLEKERSLNETDTQRQFFELVFENVTVGFAVLRGKDFIIEVANPAFRAIAPDREMLGKELTEIWPGLGPRALPILKQVLETGEPYHVNDMPFYFRRTAEGELEETYFTIDCLPLIDHAGKFDSILVLAVETTEYVRAHSRIEELAEIAQSQATELQSILENMTDSVVVFDAKKRITMANRAAFHLFGVASLDELRKPAKDSLVFRRREGGALRLEDLACRRAMSDGTIVLQDEVFFNQQTKEETYIRVSASPIKDSEGNAVGVVSIIRDVTELTELDRLKDQFLSIAAHELKTPVTIMKGYAQSLLKKVDDFPAQYARVLQAIDRGADRIDGIVKDLLDIAQLQSGQLDLYIEGLDLGELSKQVVDRMALTVYQHEIRLLDTKPAVIHADRGRIEQVLINLIDNAVRFSPDGGNIDVWLSTYDNEMVVSVHDFGIGIPEDKQARIFERFYRAHTGTPSDYGSMGIGLYISKEIIARHNGRMWFNSEEGKGSTFYFSLPVRWELVDGA